MTRDEVNQFVKDNLDAIIAAACSFPFKETVDAILATAEKTNLPKEAINAIALAAFDAAYLASENLGFDKAFELARASGKFATDTDADYDALTEVVQKELDDTKLEPYVNEEYEPFR